MKTAGRSVPFRRNETSRFAVPAGRPSAQAVTQLSVPAFTRFCSKVFPSATTAIFTVFEAAALPNDAGVDGEPAGDSRASGGRSTGMRAGALQELSATRTLTSCQPAERPGGNLQ